MLGFHLEAPADNVEDRFAGLARRFGQLIQKRGVIQLSAAPS